MARTPRPLRLAVTLAVGLLASPAGVFPQSPPVGTVETLRITPSLTLAEALSRSDTTRLVLDDGRSTTVGDLRRRVQARDRAIATVRSGHLPRSGGTAHSRSERAMARVRLLTEPAARESGAAASFRSHAAGEAARSPAGVGAAVQP